MTHRLTLLLSAVILFAASASANENAATAKAADSARTQAREALEKDAPAVATPDLTRHLNRLVSEEYTGRATGTLGEIRATAYAAECLQAAGLKPAGDDDTYFEAFPFTAGYSFRDDNAATVDWGAGVMQNLPVRRQYSPLTFSPNGTVDPAEITFVGFGATTDDYDSYDGLDVDGKWVLVFRGTPKNKDIDINAFRALIAKADLAKENGACGIIFVKGLSNQVPGELTLLQNVGEKGPILPGISIRNKLAAQLLGISDDNFKTLYNEYTQAKRIKGYELDARLSATIDIAPETTTGRNALGRLQAGDAPSTEYIVVGAHIDHLGFGQQGGSRARGREKNDLHPGADDNATGSAAVLEIAQELAARVKSGDLILQRDIVFALFSGEEMGLHGSRHYVLERTGDNENPRQKIVAYINMDMIGRPKNNTLNVNGTASSSVWPALIGQADDNTTFDLKLNPSPYTPSDATSFYSAEIPILSMATHIHGDYHTPADSADKIDFDALTQSTIFVRDLTIAAANSEQPIDYINVARNRGPKVVFGFMSGETPGGEGVAVRMVRDGMPAADAGMQTDDIIVEVRGKPITDITSLTTLQNKMKPGQKIPVVVLRDGKRVKLTVVPIARD